MICLLSLLILIPLECQARGPAGIDIDQFKQETEIFEGIVKQILLQNFTDPFAITADPKGAYLEGYGLALGFHVSVNRARIRVPSIFSDSNPTRTAPAGKRTKAAQIQLIKRIMVQCLADYGNTVKHLAAHDKISITAHVEDRNELDPAKSTTVIVLTVSKDDLDQLSTKKITPEIFRERVRILEY